MQDDAFRNVIDEVQLQHDQLNAVFECVSCCLADRSLNEDHVRVLSIAGMRLSVIKIVIEINRMLKRVIRSLIRP